LSIENLIDEKKILGHNHQILEKYLRKNVVFKNLITWSEMEREKKNNNELIMKVERGYS
jgi:hypothetical protein